jgi:hypothetical protein
MGFATETIVGLIAFFGVCNGVYYMNGLQKTNGMYLSSLYRMIFYSTARFLSSISRRKPIGCTGDAVIYSTAAYNGGMVCFCFVCVCVCTRLVIFRIVII